jgi:hypothetical protein
MASAIRDALMATEQGQAIALKAKMIPARIRELDQMVYESFPLHIYRMARNRIKSVAVEGGEAFEEAKEVIFNSRDSQVDWDIAIDYLIHS